MEPFRPGNIVELRGQQYKIVATNHDGKLILSPIYVPEDNRDMMMRLQSTVEKKSTVRVEKPEP